MGVSGWYAYVAFWRVGIKLAQFACLVAVIAHCLAVAPVETESVPARGGR